MGDYDIVLEEYQIQSADACEEAVDVSIGGTTIIGTTFDASGNSATTIPACADGIDFASNGVWYHLTGTGTQVTASLCDTSNSYVSFLYVLEGTCDSSLVCTDGSVYTGCGSHTSVTWLAGAGVSYLLYVWNEDVFENGAMFKLSLEETPANTVCENAIGPILPDGSLTYGSTQGSTADNVNFLGNELFAGRSLWYTVIGLGGTLEASTCSIYTDFDSVVGLYRQESSSATTTSSSSCESLTFISTTNSENCQVRWNTQIDEIYYIVVTSGTLAEYGNFALSVVTT